MAKISPREFMKQRRPERFSDSVVVTEGKLNASLLEYHLDSITKRNQERDFETFAVKLAQYEICPNLRMQTGPVGGGDSKADSETYPVSEKTQLNFWEGIQNDKNEKWAFAVSAKKDWVPKVKKDIASILSTSRDYKKVYFITNQFAPDKKRAEIEDKLSADAGLTVTILDRTWIIDRVFRNKRQLLAIKELNLGEGLEEIMEIGPKDLERSKAFELLNKEIEEALAKDETGFFIIKKSLRAALIGRDLDKPKLHVVGLFDRAIKIATKYGSAEQVFDAKYQKAWASYFWLEDFDEFVGLYNELETITNSTTNIYTVERQANLFNLLQLIDKQYPSYKIPITDKQGALVQSINRFTNQDTRPNASLQAESMLIMNRFFNGLTNLDNVNECFRQFGDLLDRAERMIGFHYEETIEILEELGEEFGDNEQYEALINKIIQIDTKRKGEIPAALTLLNFGLQHLSADRIYKSIDYIGRSLIGLYKEESKDDFIKALYFIAYAYEKAGLLWASRGALINAASYVTNDFYTHNNINPLQAKIYSRLKKIELRLGRVGYVLEWHQLDMIISNALNTTEESRAELLKSVMHFSLNLGSLIIRTPISYLSKLQQLPDIFLKYDLDFAAFGLLYLLNGSKYLPHDFLEFDNEEKLNEFFSKWLEQPNRNELPAYPEYYDEDNIELKSRILGTLIVISSKNSSPGIEIAETLLASLESFLSTLIRHHAIGRVPRIKIDLFEKANLPNYINFLKNDTDNENLVINYCPFDPHLLRPDQHELIGNVVFEVIMFVLSNAIVLQDPKKTLTDLFDGQQVTSRSLSFLSSMVTLGNVLGYNPKRSLKDWITDDLKSYEYVPSPGRALKAKQGKDSDEAEIRSDDIETISHANVETLGIIDENLWNKARWGGVFFISEHISEDKRPTTVIPTLGFMFHNGNEAREIFSRWKKIYGNTFSENVIITILKGVNRDKPHWYTLIMYPDIMNREPKSNKRYNLVYRATTMTPDTPINLDSFIHHYKKTQKYFLTPAKGGQGMPHPEIYQQDSFLFSKINIKYAWEVGIHDIERGGIDFTLKPYVPDNEPNAPILEIIKERAAKGI